MNKHGNRYEELRPAGIHLCTYGAYLLVVIPCLSCAVFTIVFSFSLPTDNSASSGICNVVNWNVISVFLVCAYEHMPSAEFEMFESF